MFIESRGPTDTRATTDRKELKVRLPTSLHLQLHHIKILTGRTISETVARALEMYYEENGYRSPTLPDP